MIHPLYYVAALSDPFVTVGILMQVWWLLSRMALFRVADLSFVVPVTAIGYLLSSLLGKFFLHEILTPSRWTGIGLICGGSLIVSRTRTSTTKVRPVKP